MRKRWFSRALSLLLCWVSVSALAAHPNVPTTGHSTFSRLLGYTSDGKVPYPFSKLVAFIAGVSQGTPLELFAPLGRSLERFNLLPFFFQKPRHLVGFSSGSTQTDDNFGVIVEDRVFLGHFKEGGQIEVMSHDESTGEPAFELVLDYEPGKVPVVVTPSFESCTSCHHDKAHLFTPNLWKEFNGDPLVANFLRRFHPSLEIDGAGVTQAPDAFGGVTSYAFDQSVRNATQLLVLQKVWRDGCGNEAESPACRAGLLFQAISRELGLDVAPYLEGWSAFETRFQQLARKNLAKVRNPEPFLRDREPFELGAQVIISDLLPAWKRDSLVGKYCPGVNPVDFDDPEVRDEVVMLMVMNGLRFRPESSRKFESSHAHPTFSQFLFRGEPDPTFESVQRELEALGITNPDSRSAARLHIEKTRLEEMALILRGVAPEIPLIRKAQPSRPARGQGNFEPPPDPIFTDRALTVDISFLESRIENLKRSLSWLRDHRVSEKSRQIKQAMQDLEATRFLVEERRSRLMEDEKIDPAILEAFNKADRLRSLDRNREAEKIENEIEHLFRVARSESKRGLVRPPSRRFDPVVPEPAEEEPALETAVQRRILRQFTQHDFHRRESGESEKLRELILRKPFSSQKRTQLIRDLENNRFDLVRDEVETETFFGVDRSFRPNPLLRNQLFVIADQRAKLSFEALSGLGVINFSQRLTERFPIFRTDLTLEQAACVYLMGAANHDLDDRFNPKSHESRVDVESPKIESSFDNFGKLFQFLLTEKDRERLKVALLHESPTDGTMRANISLTVQGLETSQWNGADKFGVNGFLRLFEHLESKYDSHVSFGKSYSDDKNEPVFANCSKTNVEKNSLVSCDFKPTVNEKNSLMQNANVHVVFSEQAGNPQGVWSYIETSDGKWVRPTKKRYHALCYNLKKKLFAGSETATQVLCTPFSYYRLRSGIDWLVSQNADSLAYGPFVREKVLHDLLMAFDQKEIPKSWSAGATSTPPKPKLIGDMLPPAHAIAEPGLRSLIVRCGACHNGSSPKQRVPHFLTGGSQKEMEDFLKKFAEQASGALAVGHGKQSYMPPSRSAENETFSEAERAALTSYLENLVAR